MELNNFGHFQRDLTEGFRVLVRSLEEFVQSASSESKKMSLRFQMDHLDKQIENCLRELGKQIHDLYVFQGMSDFSKEFKIHELIDQSNQLINERKQLVAENSTKDETEFLKEEEDEGENSSLETKS